MSDYQDYLNEMLLKKEYPYQVKFINQGDNKNADILEVGSNSWEKTYGDIEEISNGKLIPLDSYLETSEGKKLKATLPQNVWEAYKVNGKQYTILGTGYAPFRTAYIWDKTLADKYQIHPETWSMEIWKYKEDLEKVYNGENKNNLLTVSGLRNHIPLSLGYTFVLGECYPITIDEQNETVIAQFLYDSPKYKQALDGVLSLYKSGIYSPEKEESMNYSKTFLEITNVFTTKDAYSFAIGDKNFWKTHEVKILHENPLWKLTCTARETGISAKCPYPDDAFRLLAAIYTDKDLANALLWGKKDVQYTVNNNFAIEIGTTNRPAVNTSMGNQLICYVDVGQDPNRETSYPKQMENAVPSKLLGFNFIGKNCQKELENVFQVFYKDYCSAGNTSLLQQDNLRLQYKEAGIDKVIAEWNREFQEWRETQKAR